MSCKNVCEYLLQSMCKFGLVFSLFANWNSGAQKNSFFILSWSSLLVLKWVPSWYIRNCVQTREHMLLSMYLSHYESNLNVCVSHFPYSSQIEYYQSNALLQETLSSSQSLIPRTLSRRKTETLNWGDNEWYFFVSSPNQMFSVLLQIFTRLFSLQDSVDLFHLADLKIKILITFAIRVIHKTCFRTEM